MKHLFTGPPSTGTASPQIPWVRSVAARRTATSFLDLPAELRNEIYVLALVVPDPLVIISERLYRYLGDQNDSLVSIGDPCISKSRIPEPSDLIRVVFHSHAILRACRQVHHEATSVFFSQNVFVMSRPICDTMEECFPGHSADPHGAFLFASANWLATIGSSLPKLKKIIIDVHAFCNTWTRRDANGYHLEILALLRVLWNQDWAGEVRFQSPSELASDRRPCRCRSSYASGSRPIDANNLNQMFASLLRDDLDIRKYGKMLRHVAIQRNKPYGVVAFRLSGQTHCPHNSGHIYHLNPKNQVPCLKHFGMFELHNDQSVRMVKQETNLLGLPVALQQRIIDYVLFPNEPIDVYERKTGASKPPGILYTKRSILYDGYKRYFSSNEFIMHFDMRTSGLSNLNALSEWRVRAPTLVLIPLPWGSGGEPKCYKEQNIKSMHLNFKPAKGERATFGIIRINVAELTRHGANIGCTFDSVPVRVRIHHDLGNGSEGTIQEHVIELHRVRLRALDALRKLRTVVTSIKTDHTVNIVVNGYGHPVGYVYHGMTDVHPLP